MTTTDNRERAVEHLAEALDAEESARKDFHVREALQLLATEDG